MTEAGRSEDDAAAPAPQDMRALREMVVGYQVTLLVYAACELRIFELVSDGSSDLAADSRAHPHMLNRLLDCLVGLGLLERDDGRYVLTRRGTLLDPRAPGSMAPAFRAAARHRWAPWTDLLYSLRTGQPAFPRTAAGRELHEFYAADEEAGKTYNATMAVLTATQARDIVRGYDFGAHRTVVDVGGNVGILLTEVLAAHPGIRGVLFDLPHVVEQAGPRLAGTGIEVVAGDARVSLPPADCYLVKTVFCDFPDQDVQAILKAVRTAITSTGRVVIIDRLRGSAPPGTPEFLRTAMSALNLAIMTGGGERSLADYRRLLSVTRFRLIATKRLDLDHGDLFQLIVEPIH